MSRLTKWVNGEVWYYTKDDHFPAREMDGYESLIAMNKLAHYEDLEEQLEKLFGGKLPLDKVVENLKRTVQNGEEKLDFARILTNAEAEKWDKWKDLEEQGRLIDWRKTSEEKPDSTRHLIVAYGEIISHYGYYLKPKDKWFTDWTCEKELDAPIFWADMPDPPEESLHNDCVAKLAELKGTEE